MHPLKGVLNVPQSRIGCAALVGQRGAISQASEAKTVVGRDKDEVFRQIEETLGCVLRLGSCSESTYIMY